MSSNIVIFSIDKNKACEVAQLLSERLNRLYLNIDDLIEYDLKNYNNCSINYIEQIINKRLVYALSLECCVSVIDVKDIIKPELKNEVQKVLTIFIDVELNSTISSNDKIVYTELRCDCVNIANFTINTSSTEEIIEIICNNLRSE